VTQATTSRWRRRAATPYAFIAVPIVYMTMVIFYPAVKEVGTSFTNAVISNPNGGAFVGLDNYVGLVSSGAIWQTLIVTGLYMVGTVFGAVILGTVGAIAIDKPFRGRVLARAILAFGWAVPPVATALIWSWIYNQQSGALNTFLKAMGVAPQGWLTTTQWGLIAVTAATIWQYAPFVMLVVLAGLQSVPDEVREAARVDGADPLNVFRNVTLPHITPTLRLVALLVAVWSIRLFELIFLLTGGGPLKSTSTLVVSLEQSAFQDLSLGTAASYGVIGMIVSLVVAVIYFLFERRETRKNAL
jgi:ABC-type sugar transport systems, permease components